MKILFLDLDGPLFSDRIVAFHPRNHEHDEAVIAMNELIEKKNRCSYIHADPVAIGMLNRLAEDVDFEVVISSSWRAFTSREAIERMFEINGLNLKLHDAWRTGFDPMISRVTEVAQWLRDHGTEETDWLVLDDVLSGDFSHDLAALQAALGEDAQARCIIVDHETGMQEVNYNTMRRMWKAPMRYGRSLKSG